MTENNKLYKALDQLQFNTDNSDLKALEAAIFTKENLQALVDNKNTITVNGIPFQFLDTTLYGFLQDLEKIDTILSNDTPLAKNSLDIIMGTIFKNGKFFENSKIDPNYTPKTENGFAIKFINNGHFITVKIKEKVNEEKKEDETIFNSIEDGRQPINPLTFLADNQCCGIYALEGVLIAEELTKKNKNIEEFKQGHKKLDKTSEKNLIEQRKILFKMEILDALMAMVQTCKIEITPPENIDGLVLCGDANRDKKQKNEDSIACINKLHELYFEEFQARCTALQAVKKELGLKLDKVPEVQKIETPKQSASVTPQQITQKKEVTPETPKVETEAQKPVRRIIVENPEEEIEQKKEDKQQDKTAVKSKEGENDKKLDLPEPKQQNEAVNTLSEVIEERQECDTPSKEEPYSSRDTQNSKISTTSSILSEHPKMKQDTVYDWIKKEDTKIETYDIEDNKIKKIDNINEKAAQLYLDILMQVLNETSKESGLEEMTEEKKQAIIKQTEERIDACFTIRDKNNNIVKILTDEEKKSLELARADYKNRAKVDERVIDIFNKLDELKNYHGATKELQEKLLQQQAIASKA